MLGAGGEAVDPGTGTIRLELGRAPLRVADVVAVARTPGTGPEAREGAVRVTLAPEAAAAVEASGRLVSRMVDEGRVVYGVSTGFGHLAARRISREHLSELQVNLLRSTAAGVGKPYAGEEVRAMMLLRAASLAHGFSGIRRETLDLLLAMLERDVVPVVPEKGSVGASGDLAPLAHLALVLIGEGEAWYRGRRLPGREALAAAGLRPVALGPKEGLALINGTQAMTALGCFAAWDGLVLLQSADVVAALTCEALRGIVDAYDPRIHRLRPHPGQQATAANLRRLLAGSRQVTRQGELRVQDAYALRCVPQVHGAGRDGLVYLWQVLEREINAVTDNPLVFAEDGEVLSGGNFHGQPVALALDVAAIALAQVAAISERRTERLVNPALSGLPAFLTSRPGLHEWYMIAQYTAAALVSENKVLAHPASVDSIPTSAGQEDHVSMGNHAARKLRDVVWNVTRVLAVEAVCAAQAVDLQDAAARLAPGTRAAYDEIRRAVPYLDEDRVLTPDIEAAAALIGSGRLLAAVQRVVGPLDGGEGLRPGTAAGGPDSLP